MGYITQFVVGGAIILAIFFSTAIFFSEGVAHGGYTNSVQFASFNKTAQYGSYLNNQTEGFTSALKDAQRTDNNTLDIGMFASLFFNLGITAAVSILSMLGVGIAILGDIGVILMIPAFFIGLAILVITFRFAAQVFVAWKRGDL